MGNSLQVDQALLERASEYNTFPIQSIYAKQYNQYKWDNLPIHLWITILQKYCNLKSILALKQTSKHYRSLINSQRLWSALILREFPTLISTISMSFSDEHEIVPITADRKSIPNDYVGLSTITEHEHVGSVSQSENKMLKITSEEERQNDLCSAYLHFKSVYIHAHNSYHDFELVKDIGKKQNSCANRSISAIWRWSRSPFILAPIPLFYLIFCLLLPLRIDHTIMWKWTTIFSPIIASNSLLAMGILPYALWIDYVESDSSLKFDFFKNSMDFILLMGDKVSSFHFILWRLLHQITFWSYFCGIILLCVHLDGVSIMNPHFIFAFGALTLVGLFMMFAIMSRVTMNLSDANPLTQVISMMTFTLALLISVLMCWKQYTTHVYKPDRLLFPIFFADGMYMFAPCIAFSLRKFAYSKFQKEVAPEDLCAHTMICAGILIPFFLTEFLLFLKFRVELRASYLIVFFPLWIGVFLYSWCWFGIVKALRNKEKKDSDEKEARI